MLTMRRLSLFPLFTLVGLMACSVSNSEGPQGGAGGTPPATGGLPSGAGTTAVGATAGTPTAGTTTPAGGTTVALTTAAAGGTTAGATGGGAAGAAGGNPAPGHHPGRISHADRGQLRQVQVVDCVRRPLSRRRRWASLHRMPLWRLGGKLRCDCHSRRYRCQPNLCEL
jgi:hypothetical protein